MRQWLAWKLVSIGLRLMAGKTYDTAPTSTEDLIEDGDFHDRVHEAWDDILYEGHDDPPRAAVVVGIWPYGCEIRVEFNGDELDDWTNVRRSVAETLRFVRHKEREEHFIKSEQVH